MSPLALLVVRVLAVPWKKWLSVATVWIVAVMKPFGVWGILGLAIVDSAALPLLFLDPLVVSYSVAAPGKAILYCFMGALGSAIGSLLPYYVGRAGGELFLLKRINRQRFEKLRDRFARQEFLALMLPAMCPPPMPVKVFELAAGVFEMRVVNYFLAILAGKFLRFLIESVLVMRYGPAILSEFLVVMHRHFGIVMGVMGAVLLILAVYMVRKIFNKRRGIALPVEEATATAALAPSEEDIASPS